MKKLNYNLFLSSANFNFSGKISFKPEMGRVRDIYNIPITKTL